jgi:arylsulfatase A-like enzyme
MSLPLVAVSMLLATTATTPISAADRPNILLILADDLGIYDLSCYGRQDQATPHLDKLASQGLRFTSAYCAQPICSPSRAAILTGLAPARLHLTTFLPGRKDAPSQKLLHPQINQQLPLERKTIAEYLRGAGYKTACIGKWHLGGAKFGPKEQGFDVVHPGKANTTPTDEEGGKGEYDLTAAAAEFITENKEQPFFCYLAHNNPHVPLAAKRALVEKHRDAFNPIYAAMMETLDDTVGRLLAKLEELKLARNTIVIFASDNGGLHVPELPDTPATHNTPFRAGKGFVYEGGLRIPLIVRWPEGLRNSAVVDTPVMLSDLMPTLLQLCRLPTDQPLDGVAWKHHESQFQPPIDRTFYWHFPHYTNQGGRPAGAVREGKWKLVEQYEDGSLELYNLENDIGEIRNLADDETGIAKLLQQKLHAWRKAVNAQENTLNPNFDAALHRALYVETDVSRLQPAATARATAAPVLPWREKMNAAVK